MTITVYIRTHDPETRRKFTLRVMDYARVMPGLDVLPIESKASFYRLDDSVEVCIEDDGLSVAQTNDLEKEKALRKDLEERISGAKAILEGGKIAVDEEDYYSER